MTEMTPYLTVKEAAAELGISDDGVRKLISRKKLRAVKRSERTTLIPRPAFIAYQRKLNGTVPEPLGLARVTGSLSERLAAFSLRSGGLTPGDWLIRWVSDENPDHDTVDDMELAASAFGLLLEQRSQPLTTVPASVVEMVAAVRG
jgi:excisionase family DNA binding protein